MFVCLGTYARPLTADDSSVVGRHRAYLDECIEAGAVLCSGPREPRIGGLIILLGSDRVAAEALIAGDPFVVEGLASYEILQFQASKAADWQLLEPDLVTTESA